MMRKTWSRTPLPCGWPCSDRTSPSKRLLSVYIRPALTFSSLFSIYLFKFCCLLFAAKGVGMMRPWAGPVIRRNKINAEITLQQQTGQLTGGNDFQSRFMRGPVTCLSLLVYYWFPARSVYYQFNSPKFPLTLSRLLLFSCLFNYSHSDQVLNGSLVQHEAKLRCCSKATCLFKHLEWPLVGVHF